MVNNEADWQLSKIARQEPAPHAALRTMTLMQNGLVFPDFESIMRRIRARTEHLAMLRVKRQRTIAASVDCK